MTESNEKFQIGDLVVFQTSSPTVRKNQIGIVVNTTLENALEEECFANVEWYVVKFGTMKLIVSDEMVRKLE